jgi:hypothetical protein
MSLINLDRGPEKELSPYELSLINLDKDLTTFTKTNKRSIISELVFDDESVIDRNLLKQSLKSSQVLDELSENSKRYFDD